ncbi:TIGR01244 family sulfur transferase [Marinomonas sp.]|nr:TIGR01244 family sulfur transferase [Marinomonas sp.]MDB4837469.1 TIGR01244 family sulfur transferase [Marinomonas sp.]
MSSIVQLDNEYFVAPQVLEKELRELKAQGFEQIINNRPDGESEEQPFGESIRLQAEALGLGYINNPVDLSKLFKEQVDTQKEALLTGKKTLAFCRTGTRSSVLWVLLENDKGNDYEELVSMVSGKGFDLSRCMNAMAPLVQG